MESTANLNSTIEENMNNTENYKNIDLNSNLDKKKNDMKNILYLGLLVKEPIEKIYEIILTSLNGIIEFYPDIKDAQNLITILENNSLEDKENYKNPWRYPKDYKKWHITTLFKKGANFNKSHEAFINFEENKEIIVEIRAIVYIPNKIITSIIYTETPIENEFPHMTTLLGEYSAKHSNDVCRELFKKDKTLCKEYKKLMEQDIDDNNEKECSVERLEIIILNKKEIAYFYKFSSPIKLKTKMTLFSN